MNVIYKVSHFLTLQLFSFTYFSNFSYQDLHYKILLNERHKIVISVPLYFQIINKQLEVEQNEIYSRASCRIRNGSREWRIFRYSKFVHGVFQHRILHLLYPIPLYLSCLGRSAIQTGYTTSPMSDSST